MARPLRNKLFLRLPLLRQNNNKLFKVDIFFLLALGISAAFLLKLDWGMRTKLQVFTYFTVVCIMHKRRILKKMLH